MSRLQKLLILVLCFSLGLVTKQATKVLADEISGLTVSEDNKLYRNEMFDLSISKSEEWYAQSTEELFRTQQIGSSLISGNDHNMQALMKEALKVSLPLFSFYKYPPGTPTNETNANVSGVAENISLYPGIKKGCDYLYNVKNLMNYSQIQIKYEDDCQTKMINGSEFGYFNAVIAVGNTKLKQKYLACIKGTHAIAVIQSYDSTSENSVNEILNTLKVDCD